MQNITFPAFWGEGELCLTSGPWQALYDINGTNTQTGAFDIVLVDNVGNTRTISFPIQQDTMAPTYASFTLEEISQWLYWNGTGLWYGDKMPTAQALNATINGLLESDSGLREIVFPAFWGEVGESTLTTYKLYDIDAMDTDTGAFDITLYDNVNHNTIITVHVQRDTMAPTVITEMMVELSPWLYVNSTGLYYGNGMGALAQSFFLNGSAGDSDSGLYIASFTTAFGDTPADDANPAWWNTEYTVVGADTGDGVITLTVFDNVGNNITLSYQYYEDAVLPAVISLVFTPSSPVSSGDLNISMTFSEAIDTTIPLTTTIGMPSPYDTYNFTGAWADDRTWEGNMTIHTSTPNGLYTLNISGAEDMVNTTMLADTTYQITIDTVAEDNNITSPLSNTP
ncbi:MAG: hypothetical protein KAT70_04970, partial [Thermoplasmata archaeon]|nr:hypothetical protein [Thermoplasmata archaeon]